ncbi:hypothetical protein [Nitrosospira multiformis]|uniref:Uncharacterized protein n=1 Tax=Nitrosospira multiformis TaxID=1231 RepID=A0A1I7I436_9PROT|nr:hypothetical protein [Nitrosospira multiformis]SFU67687.1 hypothetical protein SAMN05216417_11432 [Nitrosospira multiformis]
MIKELLGLAVARQVLTAPPPSRGTIIFQKLFWTGLSVWLGYHLISGFMDKSRIANEEKAANARCVELSKIIVNSNHNNSGHIKIITVDEVGSIEKQQPYTLSLPGSITRTCKANIYSANSAIIPIQIYESNEDSGKQHVAFETVDMINRAKDRQSADEAAKQEVLRIKEEEERKHLIEKYGSVEEGKIHLLKEKITEYTNAGKDVTELNSEFVYWTKEFNKKFPQGFEQQQ